MIGKTLAHYEITGLLGQGGMGEVYRAHDARLGRDVAVKVLPTKLSGSEEVRARFEREAKTISSLNHPHICVLYDVGREGDVDFLVMELVEGETLSDRLLRGPLSTKEVLKFGGQIADALDSAHRAGVVHRDLKPGNVMLTRSGTKLMDFGLARVTGLGETGGATVVQLTHSPTIAQPLTAEGTIIGTFQYMSPEQLEGREADERSDLWALGCVLYEMATGKRAFEGTSQASLIGGIMHTEPLPVSQVAALAPAALDRLVSACLAKNPDDRVQSAHDVKLQLSWMAEGTLTTTGVAPVIPPAPSSPRSWMSYVAIALVAAAITAATMLALPGSPPATSWDLTQRSILGTAELLPTSTPLISNDGTYVLVSVGEEQTVQIYRRDLASFEMVPLAGTEEGRAPFLSPDGAWIGFVTPTAIKKVSVAGGVAQVIASYPRPSAGDWGTDSMIYFTARGGGEDGSMALARVPESGGAVEVVAELSPEDKETESWLPEILPDGKTVLISVLGGFTSGSRVVAIRPDGSRQIVLEGAFLGRITESGHLFYQDQPTQATLAVAFDAASLQTSGAAVPLTEAVDSSYLFDVSSDGKLVYVPVPASGDGDEIVWIDRDGTAQMATEMRTEWYQPRISPDGQRVLLRKAASNCELWMLDLTRGSLARMVQSDDNHNAIWSPDGHRICFERMNEGDLVTLTVEGSRSMTTIAAGSLHGTPHSWSSAGNLLAYTTTGRGTRSDIWIRPADGSAEPVAFLATEYDEVAPSFSPDGKWIAYGSDEAGGSEVFIRPSDDPGTVWQVSTDGGATPVWSRDGMELFFVSGRNMMAVSVQGDPELRIGVPKILFEGGFGTADRRDFDVGPDGRFVAVRRGLRGGRELRLLVNWPAEVDRFSGVGR